MARIDLYKEMALDGGVTKPVTSTPLKTNSLVKDDSSSGGTATTATAGSTNPTTSLESINATYINTPSVTGSTKDYESQKNHWQSYVDELAKYQAEHGTESTFDQTKFKLYQDYANSGLQKATQAYDAANAKDTAALNAKAEQANIKEQSLKYAQMAMDAQGLGSQGVASSVQAGINNQYGANVSNIENETSSEKNDLMNEYVTQANTDKSTVQQADNENAQNTKNDAFALASEMINNGVDYDKAIELYGDKMTEEQIKTLQAYRDTNRGYTDEDQTFIKENTTDSRAFTSYQDMVDADVRTENDKYNVGDVSNEAKLLFANYTAGRQNGDVVRLQHHGQGSTNGMYLIYYNGAWYKTDKAHWDSAENRGMFENSTFQKKWNNNSDFESRGTFVS